MTLKQIRTVDIQSHKDVTIDLPEKGLIRFSGKNSSGKTVIGRTLNELITGGMSRPKTRASLINRKARFGEITVTRWDDVSLKVHIAREAAQTYIEYSVPGEETVTRYLADKNMAYYVKQFGYHYMEDHEICIQYADRDAPMLFFKTPKKANLACIEVARSDDDAQTSLDEFNKLLKTCKDVRESKENQVSACQIALKELKIYDINYLKIQQRNLQAIAENLKNIYIPTIPEIPALVHVDTISYHEPNLPEIRFPEIYPVFGLKQIFIDIVKLQEDVQDILDNKCPTCGKGLVDAW